MNSKELIRQIIVETVKPTKKKEIISEMDVMSTLQDIVPVISHMISAGFLTYHTGRALINKYRQGKITERQIDNLVREFNPELSLDNFQRSAWSDEEFGEKTLTSPTEIDPRYVKTFEDDDDITFFVDDEESTEEQLDDTIDLFPNDPDTEVREYQPRRFPRD